MSGLQVFRARRNVSLPTGVWYAGTDREVDPAHFAAHIADGRIVPVGEDVVELERPAGHQPPPTVTEPTGDGWSASVEVDAVHQAAGDPLPDTDLVVGDPVEVDGAVHEVVGFDDDGAPVLEPVDPTE